MIGVILITILAGAGMSASAGIPTFRTAGEWNSGEDLMTALTRKTYMERPKSRRFLWSWLLNTGVMDARPTRAHKAIADLDHAGLLDLVVTQNIDGLEYKAGVDPSKIVQIHGSLATSSCYRCGSTEKTIDVIGRFREDPSDSTLHCRRWNPKKNKCCNGVISPDIVFYGDKINKQSWSRSVESVKSSDELWIVGCSLMVFPVADLVGMADKTIMINPSGGGIVSSHCQVIESDADEALAALVHDKTSKRN